MKSLCGGWTTSYRMHVLCNKRSCLFGCGAKDEIGHYLTCSRCLHHLALPRGQITTDLLTRLGLGPHQQYDGENGIRSSAARLAVSCRVYHMSKDSAAIADISYGRMKNFVETARRALRLPPDPTGGAGQRCSAVTHFPTSVFSPTEPRPCPTPVPLFSPRRPANDVNIGRGAASRAGPPPCR